MATPENLGVMIPPFQRPHRVAGRQPARGLEVVNVFLAFHDPDGLIGVGGQELGEMIQDGFDSLEVPNMLPVVRGFPLAEIFGVLEPDGFKDDHAVFIAVLINLIELAPGPALPGRGCGRVGRLVLGPARARPFEAVGIGA
jgi:hypothetical protein